MANIRITQLHVDRVTLASALKAAGKPADTANIILWDSVVPGLGLRINRTSKTWLWRARCNGQQIGDKIGDTRLVKVEAAREAARLLIHSAKSGVDPIKAAAAKFEAEKAAEEATAAERAKLAYTFRVLVGDYLAAPVGLDGRPHAASYRQSNRWLLLPVLDRAAFADLPIDQITRRQLVEYGDAIPPGTKGAINRSNELGAINRMLNWAVEKERVARNVLTADGRKFVVPARAAIRDRALGFRIVGEDQQFVADELVRFWHAAETLGHPFGPMLKLLLLTGARRDEVANMTWDELDLGRKLWGLPAERAKNGRGHNVPLSPLAMEILTEMPQINRSKFVFTTTGRTPVSGFGYAKNRMDQLMGDDIPAWRFHDLRRSCATGLEMLGIDARVVEACLNHKSGVKRGLVGRYQRFQFSDAKAPALNLWSAFISGLLAGEDADELIARLTGQTADRRAAA